MTIVQNFLTIPIEIDPNNKRIDLKHDVLKDKKITAIYLLGSSISNQIAEPYNSNYLSVVGAIGTEDLYLNFIDINDDHCVKDLSFNFGVVAMFPGSDFLKYDINKIIDVNKSYISYTITNSTEIRKLLLLVIYQSENYTTVTDEVNGSFSTEIKPTSVIQNILLKDYVGDRLQGKKIKRIVVNQKDISVLSYLDIFTKCGKRIENIPCALLRENGAKTFYFDNIDIDWEKSYFKQRGAYSVDGQDEDFNPITTYYYPTVTFIF